MSGMEKNGYNHQDVMNLEKKCNYFEQSHLTALQEINKLHAEIAEKDKANTGLIKASKLIADYLKNHYNDADGVAECQRVIKKYEVK